MGNCWTSDSEGGVPSTERKEVSATFNSNIYTRMFPCQEQNRLLQSPATRGGYGQKSVEISRPASTSVLSPPPFSSYPCTSPVPRPTSFMYLDGRHQYKISAPCLGIQELQELYEAVYDRYEVAVTTREKIDELVQRFKDTLRLHHDLHMKECFQTWRDQLASPVFTVEYSSSGNVKVILVRANNMPREMWPAQRYIRELLQALSLFMDQYSFLEQMVREGLENIAGAKVSDIIANAPKNERRRIENHMRELNAQYESVPNHLMVFNRQVSALVKEINESVSVLA